MNCAISRCQKPLGDDYIRIWNEPSTGRPRVYCRGCGMRIVRGNENDTLKLQWQPVDNGKELDIRNPSKES